jgi:VanZ family protein
MAKKHKSFSLLKFVFTGLLPLVAWMTFIFLLSNRQKVAFTENYPVSFAVFKSLHIVEYGILFVLFARSLSLLGCKYYFLTALIFTFAYGLSDELHQSFVIGREGKLLDASVDALGGAITWVILYQNKFLKDWVLSI